MNILNFDSGVVFLFLPSKLNFIRKLTAFAAKAFLVASLEQIFEKTSLPSFHPPTAANNLTLGLMAFNPMNFLM